MAAGLLGEIARFQEWATAISPERRHGAWECDYGAREDLYVSVLEFIGRVPFAGWSPEELHAVLFAVARDNEMQHLAREIRSRKSETLLDLTRAAVELGEADSKWQLAEELGQLGQRGGEAERLLLLLVRDENEYVRRRALRSLARLGSSAVEELAQEEWKRPHDSQQWARMNVLWCLHRVGSPQLSALLASAEEDDGQYLSEFAGKVRRGELTGED